jgi:hypothetical protein
MIHRLHKDNTHEVHCYITYIDALLTQPAEEQTQVGYHEAWWRSEYLRVVEVLELARVSARAQRAKLEHKFLTSVFRPLNWKL